MNKEKRVAQKSICVNWAYSLLGWSFVFQRFFALKQRLLKKLSFSRVIPEVIEEVQSFGRYFWAGIVTGVVDDVVREC